MKRYILVHNGKEIIWYLERKKVKNINLRIKSDLSVVVSAGKNIPIDYIIRFIESKGGWIEEHLEKLRERKERQDRNINENIYMYMGNKYILNTIVDENNEGVKIEKGILHVKVKEPSRTAEVLENWVKVEANAQIEKSIEKILPLMSQYNIKRPIFQIKKMKSRWGSCMPDKERIVLNLELMKYPKECIDYVVAHELAHFVHCNHGKEFYKVLESIIPNWREYKKMLNNKL